MQVMLNLWHTVYDGPDADADAAAAAAKAKAKEGDDKKLTFTQDQLNKMMAENRRKLTNENQELLGQITELSETARLTTEERDTLDERISALQKQYMSKEELAKQAAEKSATKRKEELNVLAQERDSWRKRYEVSTIDRSLRDAAEAAKALRPSQIVSILQHNTQLQSVLDDAGKATGEYTPIVTLNSVDKDGKDVELQLSPVKALEHMREQTDHYGNLFAGIKVSGIGGKGSAGGGGKGPTIESLKDPAVYAEWRKKNPDLDISKLS